MKRSLSFGSRPGLLVLAGTALIAGIYGLVRLAYGLFLPDIQDSVGLGTAVAGYVSTGASAAYCLGALAGLAVPHRPRLLVGAAAATATAGAVGTALAPGTAVLAAATVLASTGAGLASPGLVGIVARNVGAARADPAQATVNAGTGPGLVGAGMLALLLEWRAAFAVAAVLTAVAGVAVLVLDRSGGGSARRTRRTGSGGQLVVPAVAAVLLGVASAAVWTYGRARLVEAGMGDATSIVAWIAVGVGGTITVATARRLSTWTAPRAWAATTATTAAAIAALGLAPSRLPVALVACGLFGWGFVAASSALIAWASRDASGPAASGTSVLFVALMLGQGTGSAMAGALGDRLGLGPVFLLAAAVGLVAAACPHAAITRRRSAVEAGVGIPATSSSDHP